MRQFILALVSTVVVTVACATNALATPPAPAWNWTGFYVGGNVGYGWGNRNTSFVSNDANADFLFGLGASSGNGDGPLSAVSSKSSGALGGVQAGYNWQLSRQWVVGIAADIDISHISGSATSTSNAQAQFTANGTANVTQNVDWFGTLRARGGYLLSDNLLVFATGGLAYGHVKGDGTFSLSGPGSSSGPGAPGWACTVGGATCFAGNSSRVTAGWTAGGGLEYALSRNWKISGEYLYVNLGSNSTTFTALNPGLSPTPSTFSANSKTSFSVARAGLNYAF